MPARKNRQDKHGVGGLNSVERKYLLYWFQENRNTSVWVGDDDVVHGEHGFDSNKGQHVRGLVTKGYLERSVVPVEQSQDWYPEARTRYSLTPKGRTLCPNAKGA